MPPHFSLSLERFALDLAADLPRPQQKFAATLIPGLAASRTVCLATVADSLSGRPLVAGSRPYLSLATFLSRGLARPRLDVGQMAWRYWERCRVPLSERDGEGVNIGVDGGDYQKPHARPHRPRGMKGMSFVRDGSRSTRDRTVVGMGCASVTIEASLPSGVQLPLWHGAYSATEPDALFGLRARGEHANHVAAVERVAPFVGKRAWWTFDRGYDSNDYLAAWDRIGIRWLVRLPMGERWVTTADGLSLHLRELVHAVDTPHRLRGEGDGGALDIRMGVVHVALGRGSGAMRLRTLFVGWINDAPTPFVLLAGERHDLTAETTEMMRREFIRRWRIETSHHLMKDRHGFGGDVEGFHVMRFRSIQRLLLFWMFTQGYVALERLRAASGIRKLAAQVEACGPGRDPRGQFNEQIGEAVRGWAPKRYRRRYPARSSPPAVETDEQVWDRLRRQERAARKQERKARREADMWAERAKRAREKMGQIGRAHV